MIFRTDFLAILKAKFQFLFLMYIFTKQKEKFKIFQFKQYLNSNKIIMAFSSTTTASYLANFSSHQAKLESISVNNFAKLTELQTGFEAIGFSVKRISIVEIKVIFGWQSLSSRDTFLDSCIFAPFLLIERYDELNGTFSDILTLIFKKRQEVGVLCGIQWNGNNPSQTRPLEELTFAP